MLSKNNYHERLRKMDDKQERFSIRKFSVGAASVLIGLTFMGLNVDTAKADTTPNENNQEQANTNQESAKAVLDAKVDTAQSSNDQKQESTTSTDSKVSENKTADNKAATPNENQANETTETQALNVAQFRAATISAAQYSTMLAAQTTDTLNPNKGKNNNLTEQQQEELKKASLQDSQNKIDQRQNQMNAEETKLNEKAKPVQETTPANNVTVSDWNSLKSALSNSSVDQITVKGNLSSNDQLKTNGTGGAVATNANAVVLANAQAKATTNISNGHKVTLVGADDSAALSLAKNMQAITLSGSNWDITFKNLQINTDNQVGILDLSQTNGKQKVTFDNVRSNGSALYNGGGDTDVYIYGDTTSNVSTTTLAVANQQGFGGQYDSKYYDANGAINNNNRAAANIHAANVIITDGAKLTLTRSVDGDGIVGYDGLQMANANDQGTLVDRGRIYVGNGSTLNITLKDGNQSGASLKASERTNIENNNIGLRVNNNGTFVTGKNANVSIKVGHGRIVAFGSPNANNAPGAEANYVARAGTWTENHPNVANNVFLGEGSKITASGRDGLILGNRGTYLAGKNSTAQFNTWGSGAAANVGDFGMVLAGEGSDTKFFSDGAKNMGSYDSRFTPFALGEDGKMVVDKNGALTIVITGRGKSVYGDNIQIQSKHYHDPLVWVKDNGTLDLRADSSQAEGEILSVPLGAINGSRTAYFVVDNPKYVNIQRLAKIDQAPAYTNQMKDDKGRWGANLMYMDSTNGSYFGGARGGVSAFIAQGDYNLYKWDDENLSNGVQYDATATPKENANNFYASADQVWNRVKAFYQERKGFHQGDVEVHSDDESTASKTAQKGGAQFSNVNYGFNPLFSQRLVIMAHNIVPVTPDNPTEYYVKTDVDKDVIREVHYVVDDGTGKSVTEMSNISNDQFKTVPTGDQVKQSQHFTGIGYIDITTGELVQVEIGSDGKPALDKYGHLIAKTDSNGKVLPGSIKWTPATGQFNESALPDLKDDSNYQFERIDVGTMTKNLVDNQGNPVYVQKQQYDKNGNPVFDKDGNPVYMYEQKRDSAGNLVYDANGAPVYDHNKPLYVQAKDANGQLQWDKNGNPIYEQAKALEFTTAADQTKLVSSTVNANTPTPEVYYVVYKAKEPAKQTQATLNFYDDTADHAITNIAVNGQTVAVNEQSVSGNKADGNKPGDNIAFSNGSTIVDNIVKNGYVLDYLVDANGNKQVITNYEEAQAYFGQFGDDTKNFVLHFVHGAQLIDPDHPLAYNDPTNKQGLTGLTANDLRHNVTETINYVQDNADGSQTDIAPSKTQELNYKAYAYIDKVTGELIGQDSVADNTGAKIMDTNRAMAHQVYGKNPAAGKVIWETVGVNGKTLPAVSTVTVDGYTYDHASSNPETFTSSVQKAVKLTLLRQLKIFKPLMTRVSLLLP